MSQKFTLHVFRGQFFQVSVLKDELSNKHSLALHPSESRQGAQLMLWALECSTAEAAELARLLKSGSALASHVEEGAPFEAWRV